jgi:hypothetical protein
MFSATDPSRQRAAATAATTPTAGRGAGVSDVATDREDRTDVIKDAHRLLIEAVKNRARHVAKQCLHHRARRIQPLRLFDADALRERRRQGARGRAFRDEHTAVVDELHQLTKPVTAESTARVVRVVRRRADVRRDVRLLVRNGSPAGMPSAVMSMPPVCG